MNDLTEKDRRLAEWESTCTGMLVEGSRRAWRFFLLDEVNKLLNEQLIDSGEAKVLRERVELAYTANTQP
ncbi:hypothetical protein [Pseudomonas paracarnis]|uniref:hypothetical protein n=1 Tax=Pseudomonas paracarnis TaxID=2750625 RepID=UPI002FE27553